MIALEKKTLPLLILRDVIIFPGTIAPIFIGREKSLNALLAAKRIDDGQHILLTTQKKQDIEEPGAHDLFRVGILAKIIQTVKLPNNNAKILIEAINRVKLTNITGDDMFVSEYTINPDKEVDNLEVLNDATTAVIESFKEYARSNKKINLEILNILTEQRNPSYITNIIASHLTSKIDLKQALLEQTDVQKRAELLLEIITAENAQMDTEQVVQQRVKKQIEKTQREFYLNEQMKAIQQEMDGSNDKSDFFDLEKKIKKLKLSTEAKEKATAELKKLKMMNQLSAESSVVRNYLDTLLSLPWGKRDKSTIKINKTEEILDRDHYGLKKVKERIVEYLSVLKRSRKIRGPILCLIGPPGVGKTSLVKSIAEAMDRKYTKFALGGVRDEAEIRGHRKTYLGSMPGKIITLLKKSKVDNPVMLLDEIDKMSADFRGDPASALLEVLDPEQNSHFVDHYLEVEYDLSNIIFIATANSYDLPRALLDRMEIINIAGYIEEEKLQIAKNHLVTKQLKLHGMKPEELIIPDDTILELIRYYTKESGVRSLEREIGAIARKVLTRILKDKDLKTVTVTPKDLEEYLGVKKYRFGLAETEDQIGTTTGLAYTQVGGDLLSIEAACFKGKGGIKSTGKLGEVMKESAEAAYSCFLSKAKSLGLKESEYKEFDIHLHVPEGATPKDGPSAGIAIYTTLVSLMTKNPVNRNVAMTGEITLRGKVLPIGGLKEKLLAAVRGGIKTVLIPEENIKDLKDIPANIKDNIEIIPVSNIDQVLEHALVRKVKK
ncbi:Endopeptidase La [Candidatus Megaera venefica]|uniref:Lon protease n=1 Tax=Candidatus Megaera venefica TaxID=2055910 RepID=A0ABU5NA97_9RICK|nr:Endopeptidase La [Candidatus Megaera venefica]